MIRTWQEYLEVLKVINCMSRDEVSKALGASEWPCSEEFDDIWAAFRVSTFHGLCELDTRNIGLLCDYALNKMRGYNV